MRYRPRVTIRDLLYLVVVVALALGWFVDRQRTIARAEMQRDVALRAAAEARRLSLAGPSPAPAPTPPATP